MLAAAPPVMSTNSTSNSVTSTITTSYTPPSGIVRRRCRRPGTSYHRVPACRASGGCAPVDRRRFRLVLLLHSRAPVQPPVRPSCTTIERRLCLRRHEGMTKRPRAARGSAVFVALAVALLVRPLRAADGPLLVVVEAPPRSTPTPWRFDGRSGASCTAYCGPDEYTSRGAGPRVDRRARSRSNRDLAARERRHLHHPGDPRAAERADRLRAIAWLAGNLARDQVSPILAEAPAQPSSLATPPALSTVRPPH